MEHSSSQPPKSDPEQSNNLSSRRNGDAPSDAKESANQRMIADRLMAALASGNLDHLAQARQAFLKEAPAAKRQEPASTPPARSARLAAVPNSSPEIRQE